MLLLENPLTAEGEGKALMTTDAAPMPVAVVIASNAVVMASHSSILDRNNDYTKFLKSRWMVSRRAQWKKKKNEWRQEGSSNETEKGEKWRWERNIFFFEMMVFFL